MKSIINEKEKPIGNSLNSLPASSFSEFLRQTAPMPSATVKAAKQAVKMKSIPQVAMTNLLCFFTKEGNSVLDLFAGNGGFTEACLFNDLNVTAVDLYPNNIEIIGRKIEQDLFLHVKKSRAKLLCANVDMIDEVLDGSMYDFIFLDPSRPGTMSETLPPNEGGESYNESDYAGYNPIDFTDRLAHLLKKVASRTNKYVAVHLDCTFYKGRYYDLPGMLASKMVTSPTIVHRMTKNWVYSRRDTHLGNLGVVAPTINTSSILVFKCN